MQTTEVIIRPCYGPDYETDHAPHYIGPGCSTLFPRELYCGGRGPLSVWAAADAAAAITSLAELDARGVELREV